MTAKKPTQKMEPDAADAAVEDEKKDMEMEDETEKMYKSAIDKFVAVAERLEKRFDAQDARLGKLESRLSKTEHVPPDVDAENLGELDNPEPSPIGEVHADADAATKTPKKPDEKPVITKRAVKPVRKEIAAKPAPKFDADAFVQKTVSVLEERIAKRLDETVSAKLPELVKGATLPYAWVQDESMRKALQDPFSPTGIIARTVDEDRRVMGGHFSTGDGRFGFKSGRGDDAARTKFYRKLGETLGTVEVA